MNGKTATPEIKSIKDFMVFIRGELKPKGKILTPFNVISAPVMLLGVILIAYRMVKGLSSITNLSQEFPWGVWIGFDVMTGVAFAGGAYVLTFVVYILRSEKYHSIIRATVLNGFLAYVFYAGALVVDLGRPWHIFNPIIGNKFGLSSVLFLVAWHFLLYMIAEFIEISPALAEWLGWKMIRRILRALTLGAVIFGITLSTLHQSGLGALFMMARGKIHPLWYTQFIPILFFISSIFAGLSLVIFEGTISHRVFSDQLDHEYHTKYNDILVGLAKGCACTMLAYFFLKVLIFMHGQHWPYIHTPWGYWYLVEVIGLVLIPCFLFLRGAIDRNLTVIRVAAVLTMVGIIINRLNYTIIAFKWYVPLPVHYVPHWMEIETTLAIIFAEIWVFRWIINRMPIMRHPPEWAIEQEEQIVR
ncbi:MAG: polysulfide reductase NrfD [Deltaproteobacteria bacterium]|nr:polysulfide reductase NrfD [Deltaproteobacteria bacterium]